VSARGLALHRTLAGAAVVLAVGAAIVGTPARVSTNAVGGDEHTDAFVARTVDAVQLAAWIREGALDLRVLDLRGDSAYERVHVPSAEPADFARLDTLAKRADAMLVLYSDDDVRDAQAWANLAARGHRSAYVLDGGLDAWMEEVMAPVLHGDSADYVATLSRYFGGAPRAADARWEQKPPRAESTTANAAELGETPRRGC
jgi:rhodanese-related sulfurtransferase